MKLLPPLSIWRVERRCSKTWQQLLEFNGSSCKEQRILSKEILKAPHQPCIYLICNTSEQFHQHVGWYAWNFLLKKIFSIKERNQHYHSQHQEKAFQKTSWLHPSVWRYHSWFLWAIWEAQIFINDMLNHYHAYLENLDIPSICSTTPKGL